LRVELTFFWFGIQAMFLELAQNLFNMLLMQVLIIGEVSKHCVDEALEHCWGVGQTKRHDKPFKGPIPSVEHGFPFITISDLD
ncbi:hypothetical protein M404DRAFT_143450, partial [Pisolithus tinctorius Marx 270]